ncbi:hypothetical protein LCGC14_0536010 [marine sediment metagenome]|uniref:Uncharacterized protein n=1 Tax=marine sediment metagenome TaxID=412755 RepID=A0A0F9RYS9_9ZZZZ
MKKKKTKQEIGSCIVDILHAKNAGVEYKPGRKDGGVSTKPVVPCKDQSETDVTTEYVSGLEQNQVGAGDIFIEWLAEYWGLPLFVLALILAACLGYAQR